VLVTNKVRHLGRVPGASDVLGLGIFEKMFNNVLKSRHLVLSCSCKQESRVDSE
jgi:hypothetical protein